LRVLIAEDEAVSRRLLEKTLASMGHDVVAVRDGEEAWNLLQRELFPLVIADWVMPGLDGLELVRRLRSAEVDQHTYMILLTGKTEREDRVAGFSAGVDDYITKPFDRDELMLRVRVGERLVKLQDTLAVKNEELRQMAMIDGLTAVGNRRGFDAAYERAFAQAKRYTQLFTLAIADVDHFKDYNDQFGHDAGDKVLCEVASILVKTLRLADAVFRYGGEEFACLLPMAGRAGAGSATARLRKAVADAGIEHPGNAPFGVVTVSIGYASLEPGDPADKDELFRRADRALYQAKGAGRNRAQEADGSGSVVKA